MKIFFNKLLMIIYYIAGALILEVVAFSRLGFGSMPEYWMYDLALILVIAFLVFIIPNYTAQYVIFTIILLMQAILVYVNYSLYIIYGDLFSVDMLSLIGGALEAMNSSFVYIGFILQLIALFLTISITGAILLKYCRKNKISIKQHFSVICVLFLVSIQCFSLSYFINKRQTINKLSVYDTETIVGDYLLMNTLILKTASYKKFGTYGYLINILFNQFSDTEQKLTDTVIEYMNSGNRYTADSSDVFGVDAGNNLIVVMMESLEWIGFSDGTYSAEVDNLSSEMTPNIYSLIYGDDYTTDTTNQNTNNDSLLVKNYYSKSKTNYSEVQSILGLYPIGENLSDIAGKDYDQTSNTFGYSLPNILKSRGYTTTYVHSNVSSFYSRGQTHANIGFDNVIFKDTVLDEEGNPIYSGSDLYWETWASEADFVRNTIDYLVPNPENCDGPFYSFYLNVSSHGSYNDNDNNDDYVRYMDYVIYGKDNCIIVDALTEEQYKDDNGNVITDEVTLQEYHKNTNYKWMLNPDIDEEDLTYSEWYQNMCESYAGVLNSNGVLVTSDLLHYECGVVGLDAAIGVIIDQLKAYDIYDSTTIVLYADHNAYYSNLSNYIKDCDLNDLAGMDINRVPMILSSPGLKENYGGEYTSTTRFTSAYDIIPTIFDLFGIEFNENLYLGSSIFAYSIDDYVYTIGDETREMLVYYSATGGLCSLDVYSYDLVKFYVQNDDVTDYIIGLFKQKASELILKINFLTILNHQSLYSQLTNV